MLVGELRELLEKRQKARNEEKADTLYENSIEPPSAEMACTCQINIWWYLVSASMLQHVLAITLLTERYFHIPTECGRVVRWFFFQATLLSYFPKVYILGARPLRHFSKTSGHCHCSRWWHDTERPAWWPGRTDMHWLGVYGVGWVHQKLRSSLNLPCSVAGRIVSVWYAWCKRPCTGSPPVINN